MLEKIEIDYDRKKMKASCRVWQNGKKEHEILGIRANSIEDVFKYLRLWEASFIKQDMKIVKTAKYAGYREIAEAIFRKDVGETFTTKDLAKEITNENSEDFAQTHANVSSIFTYVAEENPKDIINVGKHGRSRVYKKTRKMSLDEIYNLLRSCCK